VFRFVCNGLQIEQRVCSKFCVKLGKYAIKTLNMLREALRGHSVTWTVVFQWNSSFKVGRVSIEDEECLGRPRASKMAENVKEIRELIHEDHRRTIHELADTAGISYGVCKEILTKNLNMRRIVAKISRRLLTHDQNLWLTIVRLPFHRSVSFMVAGFSPLSFRFVSQIEKRN
jgi:hypothetical protein